MARILDNFRQNPKLKANFDLRKELVANLRDRVIAIRAPQFPAKLENNRVVFAIDIAKESESNGTSSEKKNENDPMSRREQVWKVVKGYMANEDPNFVETLTHKVNDEEITIFKKTLPREDTGEEPMDLELDDLDNLDDLDAELDAKPENGDGNGKAIIQYFCVTVFKDQILISPDLPFLKQVLDQFGENKKSTLPEMDWFQKVNSELDKVKNPTFEGLRYILRLDLPYKAAYQLIEESKGDLPLEKMVKDLMGEDRETRLFDIKKLPKNFDKTIAPYLGYIGWSMTTEKDGWLFNGIVVRKPKAAKTSD